jgi:hypothetical protein
MPEALKISFDADESIVVESIPPSQEEAVNPASIEVAE